MSLGSLNERLIVALDCDTAHDAIHMVNDLAPYDVGFKIGSQGLSWGWAHKIGKIVLERGQKVCLDSKLHDPEDTTKDAVRGIASHGYTWFTMHGSAGKRAIQAAVENRGNAAVLVVTVLSGHDREVCQEIYGSTFESKVLQFAQWALHSGAQGIIAPPQEFKFLAGYQEFDSLLKFAVGIRPSWWSARSHHRWVMTPGEAMHYADYLIVGRPITQSLAFGMTVGGATERILDEMTRSTRW